MPISELLSLTLLTSCLSAGILLTLDTHRFKSFEGMTLLEWYDLKRKPWMMNRCMYCFGFWLSLLTLTVSTIWLPFYVILLALPAAAVTRKLFI